MDTRTVAEFYGGRDKAIKALGLYRQLWEQWEKNGIPEGRQCKIQIVSGGKLKAALKKARADKRRAADES